MTGYARVRKERVAPLCSEVWQKRNRSSLTVLAKVYLLDIFFFFLAQLLASRRFEVCADTVKGTMSVRIR